MSKVQVNSQGKVYVVNGKVLLAPQLTTKTITQNGTYNASSDNVDGYSSVTVNVESVATGIPRETVNGVFQMPSNNYVFEIPSGVTEVGDYALYQAMRTASGVIGFSFNNTETLSGQYAASYVCAECRNLTTADVSSLVSITGQYAFQTAFLNTKIVTLDFENLSVVTGNYAMENMCYACTLLEDIYFRSLNTNSFGTTRTVFSNMLTATGTNVTHTIHFPSNMQTTISNLTGYPTFGGSSSKVVLVYDLPATS